MPLSCSSIGAATVLASVSALAPGKFAVMVTVGGVISGYCAMGSTLEATRPASVMMIAMTDAKIGRWMKKCDIDCLLLRAACGRSARLCRGFFRLYHGHRRAGLQLHQVVEHHPVACFQA